MPLPRTSPRSNSLPSPPAQNVTTGPAHFTNDAQILSDKIRQGQGDALRYLESTKKVLLEGSSVGADRHIAVEFSKAGLGHLSSVFTNILLAQVVLQTVWQDRTEIDAHPKEAGILARESQRKVPGRRGQTTGQCLRHGE